jgi:hypothetical protein
MRTEPGARTRSWSPTTLHRQLRRVTDARPACWYWTWFAPCRDEVGRRQKPLASAVSSLGALAGVIWIAHRSQP